MTIPALSCGDVISCVGGHICVVWSVTVGVVHAIPGIKAAPGCMAVLVGQSMLYLDPAERRHFRQDEVRVIGCISPHFVDALRAAHNNHQKMVDDVAMDKKHDHRIRVAANQARRRREVSIRAAVFT